MEAVGSAARVVDQIERKSEDDWSYRHIWPMLYLFYFIGPVRARKRYL